MDVGFKKESNDITDSNKKTRFCIEIKTDIKNKLEKQAEKDLRNVKNYVEHTLNEHVKSLDKNN